MFDTYVSGARALASPDEDLADPGLRLRRPGRGCACLDCLGWSQPATVRRRGGDRGVDRRGARRCGRCPRQGHRHVWRHGSRGNAPGCCVSRSTQSGGASALGPRSSVRSRNGCCGWGFGGSRPDPSRGGDRPRGAAQRQGYVLTPGVEYFEKREPLRPADLDALGPSGAASSTAAVWDDLAGMYETKDLIERRIVMPLADPRAGGPPRCRPAEGGGAVRPPGDREDHVRQGVAARLGWPFVELFPQSPGGGRCRWSQAAALRDFFDQMPQVEHLVLFIDEVDEIGGPRAARSDAEGMTNELLKAIPMFRGRADRLLVVATNSVRDLDPAAAAPRPIRLRPPIGPPDAAARACSGPAS